MFDKEKILSIIASFLAIFTLISLTQFEASSLSLNLTVLASMGASTFLIFVTPHSPMAQPWPVFGGHLISAFIGVACAYSLNNIPLATALAVCLSIAGMYALKCLHPPSAATAMIAVLSGSEAHLLGWRFCYEVVAINAGAIVLLGLLINRYLLKRRYPLMHTQHHQQLTSPEFPKLTEDDFKWALNQMDGVLDVTEEDLVDVYEFAAEHAKQIKRNQK
jgi:CBS-domain-containing membrane protein